MKKCLYSSLIFLFLLTGCSFNNQTQNLKVKDDFINELALHDAVRAKDLTIVKELIKTGSPIDSKDIYAYTPLHLAARLDQYDIAKLLIQNGANVNNIDRYKDTPLLDSTRNSTNAMSKLLLCNNANKNVVDRHDMSPLHNASKNNDTFIIKMLNASDITKMCQALDITLEYYDENENKICGDIVLGVATNVNLIISEESSEDAKPFGKYKASINEDKYCAKLDKEINKDSSYIVTAIGTNGIDKDIEVANLSDLIKEIPLIEEEPIAEQEEIITGLYEDLMTEFAADFEPWNAQLDKNGLIFRFKKPEVLFTLGSSDLQVSFQDILDNFFPRYLKILNKYTEQIEKVRVEGHSSSEYRTAKTDEEKYSMNKKLSESRAKQVLEYTLSNENEMVVNTLPWLNDFYESEGMSSDYPILNEDGTENKVLSRRVEFRINKIVQQ